MEKKEIIQQIINELQQAGQIIPEAKLEFIAAFIREAQRRELIRNAR